MPSKKVAKKIEKLYESIPVTVITVGGASTLVEYALEGVVYRRFIPGKHIENGFSTIETLEAGIPYGHPWEEISITFDAEKFSREMHNAGIWTVQDALKFPQRVYAALRATFADNLSTILQIASSERKGVNNG